MEGEDEWDLPPVFVETAKHIQKSGMCLEGIFRISASQGELDEAKVSFFLFFLSILPFALPDLFSFSFSPCFRLYVIFVPLFPSLKLSPLTLSTFLLPY